MVRIMLKEKRISEPGKEGYKDGQDPANRLILPFLVQTTQKAKGA